jgi:hypothetical protein
MPFQPEDFPIFTAPDQTILQRQLEKISANFSARQLPPLP